MDMKNISICLAGLGNVGSQFIKLLQERQDLIKSKYGFVLEINAVALRSGGIISSAPLDLNLLLELSHKGKLELYPGWGSNIKGYQVVSESAVDILLDGTPTNLKTGEPSLTYLKTALAKGMHVVTLAKGGLVLDFNNLKDLARKNGVEIRYSGATAAALPTIDIANYCLAGVSVTEIMGILNGTSNYVLTKMTEEGMTFEAALKEAQVLGIAEPQPELDVGGWDTAAKILILSNEIFGIDLTLEDISVTGITHVTLSMIEEAKKQGEVIKLVGESRLVQGGRSKDKPNVEVMVGPQTLPNDHTLAGVKNTTKAIYFNTDTMGELSVIGGKSDPRAAAAAALKDIINLAR